MSSLSSTTTIKLPILPTTRKSDLYQSPVKFTTVKLPKIQRILKLKARLKALDSKMRKESNESHKYFTKQFKLGACAGNPKRVLSKSVATWGDQVYLYSTDRKFEKMERKFEATHKKWGLVRDLLKLEVRKHYIQAGGRYYKKPKLASGL